MHNAQVAQDISRTQPVQPIIVDTTSGGLDPFLFDDEHFALLDEQLDCGEHFYEEELTICFARHVWLDERDFAEEHFEHLTRQWHEALAEFRTKPLDITNQKDMAQRGDLLLRVVKFSEYRSIISESLKNGEHLCVVRSGTPATAAWQFMRLPEDDEELAVQAFQNRNSIEDLMEEEGDNVVRLY